MAINTTRFDPSQAPPTHQPGGDFPHHSRLVPPPHNPFAAHAAASPPTHNRSNPSRDLPLPGFQQTFIPNQIQPFLPPPQRPPAFPHGNSMTSFTQSARSLFPPAPGPNAHKLIPSPASRRNFDYTTASIYTDEHRANADMEFLSIVCLSLTH
jgi:hypothetical protein